MLNIPGLPDLAEVKAQVDRIDETVQRIEAHVADIHAVFQGLQQMLPMLGGAPGMGANDGDGVFSISGLLR